VGLVPVVPHADRHSDISPALLADRPWCAVRQVDYFERGLQACEVAAVPGQQDQAVSRCCRGNLRVHATRPRVAAVLARADAVPDPQP